ncbi:MAG: RluA family pseudouridine synthase, partial [Thermoanaerobaculia bacterium]
ENAEGISALEIHLATGRTHQIRVHLKALGHPLVGDPTYGEARWKGLPPRVQKPLRDFPRPALHAWRLAFAHPDSGEPLSFEAPIPDDLIGLWSEITGQTLMGVGP